MQPISETAIRGSLLNASKRERTSLTPPPALSPEAWERLDYLGWRDTKIPSLGYVIAIVDEEPTGIVLRQADAHVRSRAQCSWCEDVTLPNEVVLFSAKRAGTAGRNGDTVGTLICSKFECSSNVRKKPPVAYLGFDVEAARAARIEALQRHVEKFLRGIRDGS